MSIRLLVGAFTLIGMAIGSINPVWGQEQEALGPGGIQIEDAVMCRDVVDRVPIGVADVFTKKIEKIYCFFKVVGASEPTFIDVNWYHQGSLRSSIKLPVKSASWRTWSSHTMSPEWTGEWMVEMLTHDGAPLDSIIFFIQ